MDQAGFMGKMFGRASSDDPEAVRKIKFKMVACFSPRKSDHQTTIFTTHFTTKSPRKYHDLPPQFPKNPCKNITPPTQEKKQEPTSEPIPSVGREG